TRRRWIAVPPGPLRLGQPTLAVRAQPIGVNVLDSLWIRDHVLFVVAAMEPLRPDRDLAPSAGDSEHVGGRRQPREPGAQGPHQLLPPCDRPPPVRRAGREIAV